MRRPFLAAYLSLLTLVIAAAAVGGVLLYRDGPGDRDKAFRLLTEAVAMYRRIGMPKHLEMAEALLTEAGL